jgi:uncharacterized protein YndB with AHSA1/START domain
MNERVTASAYGELTEPMTLTIHRRLPGTIDRVWAYLIESDLRRQWMAAGEMEMKVGATFELVWRNNELTNPPGLRPDGFSDEHRMQSTITELDPPRKLSITWGSTDGVTFELKQQSNDVLLTVTHRRIAERSTRLNISAGWHMHLDVLAARLQGTEPEPFWDGWNRLKAEYERRLPA